MFWILLLAVALPWPFWVCALWTFLPILMCWGCTPQHLFALLCLSSMSFGEAAHPWPSNFAVGALNATGLQGKHGVIAQLPFGLYAASETHLKQGVTEFCKGLHFARSGFKFFPGAPAQPRSNSAFVGDYTGVGFLSSVPARAACHSWHPDIFSTARLQVVHAFASPVWLLAGVCYGFASGPTAHTMRLLESLSERVVDSSTGPRIIAGDFNLRKNDNPFASHWERNGFIEIQTLWQRLSGCVPRPTCKQCTRKDFVYVSSELVPFVRSAELHEDFFADHAVLLAHFSWPDAFLARPIWRMPKPRPVPPSVAQTLPALSPAQHTAVQTCHSADAKYGTVWRL